MLSIDTKHYSSVKLSIIYADYVEYVECRYAKCLGGMKMCLPF
jgi:hypothetical protein